MKTIHIVNYQAALEILSSDALNQALYDESAVVMRDVMLTLDGEPHRERRRGSKPRRRREK